MPAGSRQEGEDAKLKKDRREKMPARRWQEEEEAKPEDN